MEKPVALIERLINSQSKTQVDLSESVHSSIEAMLKDHSLYQTIPTWSRSTGVADKLYRWTCMIQDNGYDTEYYSGFESYHFVPQDGKQDTEILDVYSCFAVSVPGRSQWLDEDLGDLLANISLDDQKPRYSNKVPLPWEAHNSTGLLLQFAKQVNLSLSAVVEVFGYVREFRGETPVFSVLYHRQVSSGIPGMYGPLALDAENASQSVTIDNTHQMLASAGLTWNQTRQSLVEWLAMEYLHQDYVAAEYLLLWIVSRVYKRLPGATLGSMTMHLSRCPSEFGKHLAGALEKILAQFIYIPLTVEMLNTQKFIPEFHPQLDNENPVPGQLSAGMLQLANDTHVLVDEGTLTEGQLKEAGVRNWQQLQRTIAEHTVACVQENMAENFEYPVQLNWLVVSDSVTIKAENQFLPAEIIVPLLISGDNSNHSVDQNQLKLFRLLIQTLRYIDVTSWNIPEELVSNIQAQFVENRRMDTDSADLMKTPEDLVLRLSLARWLSLSKGESILTAETWEAVCSLEAQRIGRISLKDSNAAGK